MGTLYIDRRNMKIRLDRNALAFYANGEREGMVPINPLERVILIGNLTIETPVFHRLAGQNVSILLVTGKGMKFGGMFHGKVHNNGLLRLKQYEKSLNPSVACGLARNTVVRKVTKQEAFLREALDERPDKRFDITRALGTLGGIISSLHEAEDVSREARTNQLLEEPLATYLGFEGSAAAAYFSGYTALFPDSLSFTKRTRRPPKDPVNALMSLLYTLLHYESVREVTLIGLDPTIGFLHQFEYGRESLACDVVELFRTDADRFVWTLFRERKFTGHDFATDPETSGCYLKKGGRSRFYPLYEEWSKTLRPVLRDEVRKLARYILDGEEPFEEAEMYCEN